MAGSGVSRNGCFSEADANAYLCTIGLRAGEESQAVGTHGRGRVNPR